MQHGVAWARPVSDAEAARRATGRSHYNGVRQARARWRRTQLVEWLAVQGSGFWYPRGGQARAARAFGVSRATICRDIAAILAGWNARDWEDDQRQAVRRRRWEAAGLTSRQRDALDAYTDTSLFPLSVAEAATPAGLTTKQMRRALAQVRQRFPEVWREARYRRSLWRPARTIA